MVTAVEQAAVLRPYAQRYRAEHSFVDFLEYVRIESDDPEAPGAIPWEPWEFLMERAVSWDAGASEVILKTRQVGFSVLAAAYALWTAMYHETAHVGMFSKGEDDAKVLLGRAAYIHGQLPPQLQDPGAVFGAQLATFSSGSTVRAFPSTVNAGLGHTFRVVLGDEAAAHPYGQQNYAAIRPTLSAGGQYLCMSTANPELGPAGFFHDMYWASKRGETPYSAVFVPWDARPGRDAAWLANERAAFHGMAEAFDAYYPSSDAVAFTARSGLVYPQFSERLHIAEPPCRWEDCKRRVAGVDFGGGDPTVVLPLGMTGKQHLHQFGEFYRRGPVTTEDIGHYLWEWHKQAPFSVIACDPSEPVAIATLASMGLPVKPADNRRGEGLGAVAFLLDNNRFTMSPECTNSRDEFRDYRWAERVDPYSKERYKTSTPVENHADGHDARRYAVMEVLYLLRAGPVVRDVGRRRARVPV